MIRTDIRDDALDDSLRALDVADPRLSAEQTARKDALLAGLLADEPTTRPVGAGAASGLTPGRRAVVAARRHRRHRRRAVRLAAPLLAAAAAATWFSWPGHPGTGTSSGEAFASWTARPSSVDPATVSAAEGACRARGAQYGLPAATVDALRAVLRERRGEAVFVYLVADDGTGVECFASAERPDEIVGTSFETPQAGDGPPPALGPEQISITSGGEHSQGSRAYASTVGRVGPDVRAVTIHAGDRVVQATVSDGYVAAWWPVPAVRGPGADAGEVYDVTLSDGTVIADAPLAFVQDPTPIGPRKVGRVTTGTAATGAGVEVATLNGHVGADVVAVAVHAGGVTRVAPRVDRVFAVDLPKGTDTSAPTFDLTLRDGTVLTEQRPLGR